jgi:hypothetical protein
VLSALKYNGSATEDEINKVVDWAEDARFRGSALHPCTTCIY